MGWTTAELPLLRSRLGESTALWATNVQVEPGRWKAFSRAFSPRYNLALCHGSGVLPRTIDEVAAAGMPAIVMVAGAARAEASELDLGDFVPVAEMPFMLRELGPAPPRPMPDVRRLTGQEIDPARRLIAEVFSLHDRLALVALPGDAADKRGQAVWGAFDERGELVSCVVAVVVGDAVTIWSMATDPSRRRQGHGARVLTAALAGHARVRISLLYAPVEAEAFYRSLGYEVLEYWQLLTRRRWLGAA